MRPIPILRSISVFILALAFGVQAGVLLVSSNESLTQKQSPVLFKVAVDKDKVRIDADGAGRYFIYRGDKDLFWIVDNQANSYVEMSRQDLAAYSARIDSSMAKLKSEIKAMPPEQREKAEKKLKGILSAQGGRPKTTYAKVAGADTVNGWACLKYEGLSQGSKRSEMWTTDPAKLGVREADYQAIKEMGKFFGTLMRDADTNFGFSVDRDAPGGLPVKTIAFRNGSPAFKTEVKEVKQQEFAVAMFEVPAGMAKKGMGRTP